MGNHSKTSFFRSNPLSYDLISLSLLFIIMYGAFLGGYPIYSPDEARYSEVAREMLRQHQYLMPYLNHILFIDKPPLFYWLQALILHIFGIHPWSLRLLPVFCNWLMMLACYGAGTYLQNRRTGLMAAVMFASCLMMFIMGHVPNMDIPVATLMALSLIGFITIMHPRSTLPPRLLYFCYGLMALAILCKGMMGIALPAMVVGCWIIVCNQWHLIKKMHLISGLILMLLIATPWFVLVQQQNHNFFHFFFYVQQIERYTSTHFNAQNPFWTYPLTLIVGFTPFSVLMLYAFCSEFKVLFNKKRRSILRGFFVIWIISITLFFSIPASKVLTYILPVLPAMALLTALSWGKTLTAKHYRYLMIQALVLLVIAIVALLIPHTSLIQLPNHANINSTLYALSVIYAVTGIILIIASLKQLTMVCALSLSLGAFFLNLSIAIGLHQPDVAQAIIPNTEKTARIIKHHRQAKDQIVVFHNYFFDLPLLLDQTITIVTHLPLPLVTQQDNWAGQFQAGVAWQPNQHNIINDSKFTSLWQSNQRVWVITDARNLSALKNIIGQQTQAFAKNSGQYLFINHPKLKKQLSRKIHEIHKH